MTYKLISYHDQKGKVHAHSEYFDDEKSVWEWVDDLLFLGTLLDFKVWHADTLICSGKEAFFEKHPEHRHRHKHHHHHGPY